MKSPLLLFALIFSQVSFAMTFEEAGLYIKKDTRKSKEFRDAQKVAVDNLWHSTGQCFNNGSAERVQLILEISDKGRVANVWSDKSSERATCLKQKAKQASFPTPSKPPEYIKIIM